MSTLTKFTHSCVRLDDGDRSLVIDPGGFSEVETALDGAQGVLITHEHADHLDEQRLRAAATADPRLRIWAPSGVAGTLADLGEQVVPVAPGDSFDAAGFAVETLGGQHALIHPTVPVVANNGYLIDGTVYHPGDSFIVPTEQVQVLLLPIHAPWSRVADVIDFAVSVRAPRAFPIHDALLSEFGLPIVEGHVIRIGAQHGVEYAHLAAAKSVDI
jgi:L-ascorbate metabolism protein UlaG (beta-lactamase superfamily)